MSTHPRLARITLFPIKSLDGVAVDRAVLTAAGSLAGDREFALLDAQGKFINGKRNAAIHQIRATFDLAQRFVTLRLQADSQPATTFHLDHDRAALAAWFSDYFQQPVTITQNREAGFPDDPAAWGPTLISTGSIATVASWFPDLTVAELRDRLRTNLEIDEVEPFWEEQLYSTAGNGIPFQIGAVPFLGTNPCQRCIVPTRNSQTGEPTAQFQKTFMAQRQTTLPPWAERSRFNHFYRLAINTQVPAIDPNSPAANDESRMLQVGDQLTLASDSID